MGRLVATLHFYLEHFARVVRDSVSQVFRFPGQTQVFAAKIERPGPLLYEKHEDRETGPAKFLGVMADFSGFLSLGKPAMEFTDRVLKCIDCGAEFVFTAGEQLFFHDKQFTNDPKRCKQCKAKRAHGGARVRSETRTTCSECGAETSVPFKPTQGRPVLCRSCFQKQAI
jgi:CxxC-x17-CxxC domain-containing protein